MPQLPHRERRRSQARQSRRQHDRGYGQWPRAAHATVSGDDQTARRPGREEQPSVHYMLKNSLNRLNPLNLGALSALAVTVSLTASTFAADQAPRAAADKQPATTATAKAVRPQTVASHPPAVTTMLPSEQTAVVKQYCAGCHS